MGVFGGGLRGGAGGGGCGGGGAGRAGGAGGGLGGGGEEAGDVGAGEEEHELEESHTESAGDLFKGEGVIEKEIEEEPEDENATFIIERVGIRRYFVVRVMIVWFRKLTKSHNWVAMVWPAGKRVYPKVCFTR